MEEKDKYLFLEFLFTFFLLHSVVFLFGEALSKYALYLAPGLICGFYLSWLNRNKQSPPIKKILINLGILAVFIRMIYSVGSSSWVYRDIILILVREGILLEIVFSFNSSSYSFLGYMQALSLPLFMCSPLFIEHYNKIQAVLILIYLVCWAAILKLKFYKFFKQVWKKKLSQYNPFIPSTVIFLIILIISWILFYFLLLGKIPEGGAFIHKGKEFIKDESLEKEYYDSQDKVQEEISGVIYDLKTKEGRDAMIELLSSLMTGENITEVKKAELGLISYLQTPGPGSEAEQEEMITLVKDYLDKKILFNLKNIKEKMTYVLKKYAFNIMERISILSRINKIQYSDFYPRIREYESQLQKIINNSSVNIYAKKELREHIGEFKKWKAFEIYLKKIGALEKKIVFLDKQLKKEFSDLLSDIKNIEDISDFEKAENKIKILKYIIPSKGQALIKDAEEILDILLEFFLPEEIRKLKEKLENSNLPIDKVKEIGEALDKIKNIKELQDFLKSLPEYKESIKKEETKSPEEALLEKEKKLLLIRIIPDYSKIPLGDEKQLMALGEYSDDSREDLTLLAEWRGTDDSIASISKGKVSTHSIGEIKVYAEFQGIESLPATVIVEEAKLISIILTPENSMLPMRGREKLNLKAEGQYTDSSHEDITSLVSWELSKLRIVKVAKGVVRPLDLGAVQVYAVYSEIKSNPANIKVTITIEWLLWLIFKIISLLMLGIIIIFFILYVLTERKKDKLKVSLTKNPREFIVNIYDNAKKILLSFGLKHKGILPILAYGRFVDKSYSMENNLFSKFTMKFAEAKYSRHILEANNAASALNDYNNFLKILFRRHTKLFIFYKYFLSLLQRTPLFIDLQHKYKNLPKA